MEVVIRAVEWKEGYFVRDLETNTVICPAGEILGQKCKKTNGYTRYMCKSACYSCKDFRRCYGGSGKWKEIDFAEGAVFVRCRNWDRRKDL